MMGLSDSSLR